MAAVKLLLVLGVVVALVAGVPNNPRHQEILEDIASLHAATGPEITIQQSIFPVVRQEAPRKLSRSFAHLLDFRTLKEASKRTCFPNNAPEVTAHLDTCCWYNDATCCSPTIAALVVPYIKGNLSALQEEVGLGDQCYYAIADLVCMICAPNTADFIVKKVAGDGKPSYQIHICDSLCTKMFSACKNDLNKIPGLTAVTNGEQFCSALFQKAHESGNIVFDPKEEKSCYDGVPLEQVDQASCLPHQTKSGDDGSSTTVALIVVPIVVSVALLLAVAAGVVGFLWYKKRRDAAKDKAQMDIVLQSLN